MNEILQCVELGTRLVVGPADHGEYTRHDLQIVRVPAVFGEPPLYVLIERLGFIEGLVRNEDHLRGLRGEFATGIRCPGLHDHWPALRRAGDVERAAHLEMRAAMVERMQLVRIEIESAFTVTDESVVFPTVPEACDDVIEFACALVANCVSRVLLEAEVEGFRFAAGGNQVPAPAAAAQVVERGELACD